MKELHRVKPLWLICCCIVVSSQAFSQQANFNIDLVDKEVREVIELAGRQSDYRFFYSDRLKDLGKKVSVRYTGSSVEALLDMTFKDTDLEYKINEGYVVAISPRPAAVPQAASRVSGKVTDKDGNPMAGVTVVEPGSTRGVVTDMGGNYSITVSAGGTLTFSFLNYETLTETVGARSVLNVVLYERAESIDEVVVVGYRTVKKVSLAGAVGTISMPDKETQNITNISQAFYGTPGLWVNQGGARPGGDGATIKIRGHNTLNSSGGSPLVLLDGVEYDFNEIDPNTIESISVLKDVSAAIYGSKAANGVILITSKKGKRGAPKVEYNGKFAFTSPTQLPNLVTDPIRYMRLRSEAEINSGFDPSAVSYKDYQIEEYAAGMSIDPYIYPASDWYDILIDNGWVTTHNVRLTGGTDNILYTIGAGYMNQKGVFIANDDAQRYSMDLKLDAKVTKRLRLHGNFQGTLRQQHEFAYGLGTVMRVIQRGLPIFSDLHDSSARLYGTTWLNTPGRNNIENPRMEVESGNIYRDYQELMTTLGAEYDVTSKIKYYNTLSYRKIDHFSKNWLPEMFTINPKTAETRSFSSSAPSVKDWDAYHLQYGMSHRFVYENIFRDKHDVHVMFGHEFQDMKRRNFTAYNRDFNDSTLKELDANTNVTLAQITGNSSFDRLVSVFSRLAYAYDEKYFLEGTFRYDGSNRLAAGHRWAFFPSVLAAWRIDREEFFDAPQIDLFKLRGSVGQMGSQSVALYSYMTLMSSVSGYSFNGSTNTAWAATSLSDSSLGWETTTSYNVGFDLSAFRGKITLEGDVFLKRTKDILRRVVIPSQIGGLSGPTSNAGVLDNKGFELTAYYRNDINKWRYGVFGTAGYVKNKVVDVGGDTQIISSQYIIKEGHPYYSYYLYKADGYFQTQEEIENATTVYGGNKAILKPGYMKYADVDDSGTIDDQDRVVVGNSIPEWTYSFGFNVGWKNFNLDAQFQGVGKVYVYPAEHLQLPFNNGGNITTDYANNSWSETNRTAKYPLLTTYTNAGYNFIKSTHWLENASYLRLKNIQLTYSVPAKALKKLKMEKMTIYVSGQNMLTFSGYKLWDPEVTTTSANPYEYPNTKSYTMGINIVF